MRGLFLLQDDAGIDHLQALAFFVNEYGVGVRLGDLVAQVIDHAGIGAEQVLQRARSRGGFAAGAGQDGNTADLVDHLHDLVLVDRGHAEGNILEHFDEDAAQAEHDRRAEGGIVDRADDDFRAQGRHFLHGDAADVGIGLVSLQFFRMVW